MVAYERVFETEFDWQTKQFSKWSLTGSGRLWEVVDMRELTYLLFFYYCFTVLFYTNRWWIIVSKWNIFWRFYSPAGLGYFQGKLWINAFNFSIINCCGQKWLKVPVTLFPGNITNWFRRARYLSVRSGSDADLCISWT